MGRERLRPLRPDWEQVKDDIMRWGVLRKFETHADIREVLLSTGDELIFENSPIDYYWGGRLRAGVSPVEQSDRAALPMAAVKICSV
jgi:ribA/ribD-fused uncharacterized protein